MPEHSFLTGIDVTIELAGLKFVQVTRFSASDAIGRPYSLQLDLETEANVDAIDLATALGVQVQAVLEQERKEFAFSGIISRIDYLGCTASLTQRYRLEAVPRLALAALTRRCQVYNSVTIPRLLCQVLDNYDIVPSQSLQAVYPTLPHVMQYEETDLDFITRLMEQEGIIYYFRVDDHGKATMVLSDSDSSHPDPGVEISATQDLLGGDGTTGPVFTQSIPIKQVTVKDYDPKHPETSLSESVTLGKGATAAAVGQVSAYDQQFAATQTDAKRYAGVRLQQFASAQCRVQGSSHLFRIRAGHLVRLSDHPVPAYNTSYLVLSVEHELDSDGYCNRFTLLPKSLLPYCLPQTTPIPRIPGFLLGRVTDTAGTHSDLEVDGAYSVSLTAEDSTSTRVVRMAQPYGGKDRGMHFPIPPETEILIGHVNGDPNRPIIAGTLPNTDAPSVVKDDNKTQAVLRSAANSSLIFEDDANKQQLALASGGGHQLVMLDAGDSPAASLTSKGGHTLKLDDTSASPTILLESTQKHALKFDGTSSAPKASLTSSSGHELVLDDTAGAGKVDLKSKGGHELLFDDTPAAGKIGLSSNGGHSVTLDDTAGSGAVSLKSSGGHSVVMDDAVGSEAIALKTTVGSQLKLSDLPPGVTLSSEGTMSIKALQTLTIQVGEASITLDASGKITLSGLEIQIAGQTQVEITAQAQLSLSGQATVAVKGGLIQLN